MDEFQRDHDWAILTDDDAVWQYINLLDDEQLQDLENAAFKLASRAQYERYRRMDRRAALEDHQ